MINKNLKKEEKEYLKYLMENKEKISTDDLINIHKITISSLSNSENETREVYINMIESFI